MAKLHAFPDAPPSLAELWDYDDVAVEVLRCLPPRCLCRAAAVSRRWRSLAASDTLWSEKVAQVLSLPASAAKSALPLKSHSAKAGSAAQLASPGTPQPPPHAAEQRGANESEAQRVYADAGVCFASSAAPLLPFSPVLLAPPIAPSAGSASPGRHGGGQEQHMHSHLPLIVPEGSWKEVYRGLVELDREWKVPPQLPLQAVGSSSEEEGWGAEWTLRDDFFWFSQPFSRLQEARESLTFRLDLPLCLVTGVEIVSGQDIWNAVCPNFLQVQVGFSPSAFPFSSASFPLSPAPISHLLRLPPSALALGNHVRLLLSGSPWGEGGGEGGGRGGGEGGEEGCEGGWGEGGAGRGSKGRGKSGEGEGTCEGTCSGGCISGASEKREGWERKRRTGKEEEEGGGESGWGVDSGGSDSESTNDGDDDGDGDGDGDGGGEGCMWGGVECEWRALMRQARGRLARRIHRTLSCSSSSSTDSISSLYSTSSLSLVSHSPIPSRSTSPLRSPSSSSPSRPSSPSLSSPSLPAYLLAQTASTSPHRPAYILPQDAPPPPPRFCIERVRVFGIPLGALPPQNTLQAALVRYAVGRDGGELNAVMRSAVGRGVRELGSVERVVRALGENLVDAFASQE
ncbi:unnamed protein product [Closterium sp. Naga37s-1]|nr:unnamed protein product [Closterium sp. Naga37s-1]